MVASGFYFYLYMNLYAAGDFENVEHFLFMLLSFIQFGTAVGARSCNGETNHGFYVGVFDDGPNTLREAMEVQI